MLRNSGVLSYKDMLGFFLKNLMVRVTVMKPHKGCIRLILFKYWLHERVTWEIVTPRIPMLTEGEPRLTLVFEGWQFPLFSSRAVNNYYIILNVNQIYRLHYVWFQNNPGHVNILVCTSYSVNSNIHMTPVRIYGEPYAHKFCTVDIFWNITRPQAISPIAKFHHVLGRGFMIQGVILIFIKCFSANQNQLFYMKV